jgi:hypothetical protein
LKSIPEREKEELQRRLDSLKTMERIEKDKNREREVVREFRKKAVENVRAGKKAFFPKQKQIREEVANR